MAERLSVLYGYGGPLIAKAAKEPLTAEDFGTVADHLKTKNILNAFFKRRGMECEEGKSYEGIDRVRNSLLGLTPEGKQYIKPTNIRREIFRAIRRPLLTSIALSVCRSIFVFVQIFIIWTTIKLINGDQELLDAIPEVGRYFFVLLMPFCAYMQSLCQHNVFHMSYSSALTSRSFLVGLLYEKLKVMSPHSLSMTSRVASKKTAPKAGQSASSKAAAQVKSDAASHQVSSGFLVNLVSSDANMVVEGAVMTAMSLASTWEIVGALVWICIVIGWAGAVLAGVLFMSFPLQYITARKVATFRSLVQRAADARLRSLAEFISGINVVKLNAWEGSVKRMISAIRDKEEVYHIAGTFWKLFSLTFIFVVPGVFSIAVFGPLISYDSAMGPTDTFLIISLLGTITRTYQMIPRATTVIAQALVATDRIEGFLVLDALTGLPMKKEDSTNTTSTSPSTTSDPSTLSISGTFGWNGFSLSNINITCNPASLTVVLGTVGCGKSTLLQSILGECQAKEIETDTATTATSKLAAVTTSTVHLPVSEGQTGPCRIAYVPQEAWILDTTVRENILFGLPFDEDRYREVIIACCLVGDLQQWGGDFAEVGEKGLTLSGGQRQRLSLARACYADSDVYLLDDPISAVDANVGRLLLQQCITGYLSKKIVILVTHHPAPARMADQVVFLDIGVQKGVCAGKGAVSKILQTPELAPLDGGGDVDNTSFATSITDDAIEILKELELEAAKTEGESNAGGGGAPQQDGGGDDNHQDDTKQQQDVQAQLSSLMGTGRDLRTEEVSAIGSISPHVYRDYIKGGGVGMFFLTVFLVLFAQGLRSTTDWWFSAWTSRRFADDLTPVEHLYVLIGLVAATMITAIIRTLFFGRFVIKASSSLHNSMFNSVIACPSHFFESVPQGRIMNRFSKDVDSCDDQLPRTSFDFVQLVLIVAGSLSLLIYAVPWFAIAVGLAIFAFAYLLKCYIPSARYVKRIEGASRSPVMQLYQHSISGISTLRAYHRLEEFQNRFYEANDRTASAIMHGDSFQRWVGIRMDIIAVIWVGCIALLVIGIGDSIGASIAGLALSQSIQLTGLLQYAVRMAAETESLMTAVERLQEYSHLKPEENNGIIGRGVPEGVEFIANVPSNNDKPHHSGKSAAGADDNDGQQMATMGDNEPIAPAEPSSQVQKAIRIPAAWPQGCDLVATNLTASHHSNPERNVLQNLNFRIKAGQRVAVVGRTGAGKSSLLSAVFRLLIIPSNSIKIGGIDITELDVFYLRSRLGIIPQVPTLFHGTLRYNLDPFNRYTDEQMLTALKKVSLEDIHVDNSKTSEVVAEDGTTAAVVVGSPLDMTIGEGGGNLSVGQKQLLCAARALLANPPILFMDEATANIDKETDEKIQTIMRKQANDTGMMVITIAHRLNTIMDYDLVLVLSSGRLVEFGNPMQLAQLSPPSETNKNATTNAFDNSSSNTTGDLENDSYFQTHAQDLSEVGLFAQMVRNMDHNA